MRDHQASFMRSLLLPAVLTSLLFTASCQPSEENQIIDDLEAVVDEASTVVTIPATAEGTPSDIKFAQAACRAVWFSASELNSSDSLYQRNKKISAAFNSLSTPQLDSNQDAQQRGAMQVLSSGIAVLKGRLEENRLKLQSVQGKGDQVLPSIPAEVTGHLLEIRNKAADTIAAADLLLKRPH